jgi:hypothetical protein
MKGSADIEAAQRLLSKIARGGMPGSIGNLALQFIGDPETWVVMTHTEYGTAIGQGTSLLDALKGLAESLRQLKK